VNDLVIIGIDEHIELVSRELRAKFPVKDPGPVTDVLHIRSWRGSTNVAILTRCCGALAWKAGDLLLLRKL
jgi:hypothetical protein